MAGPRDHLLPGPGESSRQRVNCGVTLESPRARCESFVAFRWAAGPVIRTWRSVPTALLDGGGGFSFLGSGPEELTLRRGSQRVRRPRGASARFASISGPVGRGAAGSAALAGGSGVVVRGECPVAGEGGRLVRGLARVRGGAAPRPFGAASSTAVRGLRASCACSAARSSIARTGFERASGMTGARTRGGARRGPRLDQQRHQRRLSIGRWHRVNTAAQAAGSNATEVRRTRISAPAVRASCRGRTSTRALATTPRSGREDLSCWNSREGRAGALEACGRGTGRGPASRCQRGPFALEGPEGPSILPLRGRSCEARACSSRSGCRDR